MKIAFLYQHHTKNHHLKTATSMISHSHVQAKSTHFINWYNELRKKASIIYPTSLYSNPDLFFTLYAEWNGYPKSTFPFGAITYAPDNRYQKWFDTSDPTNPLPRRPNTLMPCFVLRLLSYMANPPKLVELPNGYCKIQLRFPVGSKMTLLTNTPFSASLQIYPLTPYNYLPILNDFLRHQLRAYIYHFGDQLHPIALSYLESYS